MTAVLLVGMLVLILVNAFFVAAEFALVRARRSASSSLEREIRAPGSRSMRSARSASICLPASSA